MRYINLDKLRTDPEATPAIDSANAALSVLLAEPNPDERRRIIAANRARWVAFREHFERAFGMKCWYIECENPGTDDDVDHFRPKGGVAEDLSHGGYWWEALQWRNFRLSCHRANRLRENPDDGATHGKGEHFPLLDEGKRCQRPGDDLQREEPALLDPTDPDDPPLITFNMDGTVSVAAEYSTSAEAIVRVDESRIYLHLEWPAFKSARREIYRQVWEHVQRGDEYEGRFLCGEAAARRPYKQAVDDLLEMCKDSAPYSRAARAYVRIFRNRPWVRKAVISNFSVGD